MTTNRRALIATGLATAGVVGWVTPIIQAPRAGATAFIGTAKCQPKVGAGLPDVVASFVHHANGACGLKIDVTNPTGCTCSNAVKKVCAKFSVTGDERIYQSITEIGNGATSLGYLSGSLGYTVYIFRMPAAGQTAPRPVTDDTSNDVTVCIIARCIGGVHNAFGAERYVVNIPNPGGCTGSAGSPTLNFPTDCGIPNYSSGGVLPGDIATHLPGGCTLS